MNHFIAILANKQRSGSVISSVFDSVARNQGFDILHPNCITIVNKIKDVLDLPIQDGDFVQIIIDVQSPVGYQPKTYALLSYENLGLLNEVLAYVDKLNVIKPVAWLVPT